MLIETLKTLSLNDLDKLLKKVDSYEVYKMIESASNLELDELMTRISRLNNGLFDSLPRRVRVFCVEIAMKRTTTFH